MDKTIENKKRRVVGELERFLTRGLIGVSIEYTNGM